MARPKKEVKVRGVYEREKGSDYWWIRFATAEGKERREPVGSKSDAIKLYQKRKTEVLSGVKLPETKRSGTALPTFAKIADHGLAWFKANKRDGTLPYRVAALKQEFGEIRADKIRPVDIYEYLNHEDKEFAPGTKNKHLTAMNMIYREARKAGLLPIGLLNPCRGVEYLKEPEGVIRWLTIEEEKAILAQIRFRKYEYYADHFLIAVLTGMRKGEQFTLEWPEVDLDRARVRLSMTKNGDPRIVELSPRALECFTRLWDARDKRTTDRDAVFVSDHRDLAYKDPRMWFNAIIDDLTLLDDKWSNVTWHVLRHTFCSRLVQAGEPIRSVQKLAGHKTLKMTERYAHLAPANTANALIALDSFTDPVSKKAVKKEGNLIQIA
jgi:site-specific recombinase XerD